MRHHFLDCCKRVDATLGRALGSAVSRRRRTLHSAPRDILVLRLWGLGNLALMAPLFCSWRGRRVRLLTLARHAEFLRHQFPWLELLLLREPPDPRGLSDLVRALHSLHKQPPDVVIDGEAFLRLPALAVRWACAAPIVGLDTPGQARGHLLDASVPYDPARHVADGFAALARAARLPSPSGVPGGLSVSAADRRRIAAELPPGSGPLVVLHPGSGEHFPGRRWPAARFAALAARLQCEGARVVLTGVIAERALTARIAAEAGAATRDLAGRLELPQFLALLERAAVLVANDTGPVHLADALGTACVALYGPNAPQRCGPRQPGSRALFAQLPCSPCLDDRTMKRSACTQPRCLEALEVDEVLRACRALLPPSTAPRPLVHALAH
ncbi:MAG: glycosyltransferase family 9 protein [Planctomycetota bacterium]